MHDSYSDIKERIAEEPMWFDENGTPRYGKFKPDMCPDIYADVVVLMEIACQHCGERLQVQMSRGWMNPDRRPPKKWHYGDPPWHDCTGAGESMNCDDIAVLEVWRFNRFEWKRLKKLEGSVDDAMDATNA